MLTNAPMLWCFWQKYVLGMTHAVVLVVALVCCFNAVAAAVSRLETWSAERPPPIVVSLLSLEHSALAGMLGCRCVFISLQREQVGQGPLHCREYT